MKAKDIIVAPDFYNLVKDDVDEIVRDMDIEVNEGMDERIHLYNIKDLLFESERSRIILENKIFAGRTSVKWYKINNVDNNLNEITERLESEKNNYNKIADINTRELDNPKIYSCIKLDENIYMMRVFVPSGSKTINDGVRLERIPSISNAVLIINLIDKYIEIRAAYRDAKRIFNYICKPLFGDNLIEIDVLGRYDGCIEKFKSSLRGGKFIDVKSIPDLNILLTKEQNELLVNTLETLDEYFISKDVEKLKNQLSDVNLGTDDIPFTQLFLAGLSGIGLTMREDFEEDLSNQSLYGILKSYMTNQEGFIKFTLQDEQGIEVNNTIQVGIKTNTISFRSSSTEKTIEYIRKMILGY